MIHRRTKIIAAIAFGFFIFSLGAYVLFFFMIEGHKETLRAERVRAAEAEVQARALSALQATVVESKEDREKLLGFILTDDEIIDFLALIEQTAREQGVKLETTLEVRPLDDVFEELALSLSIEGSFDGVMRMLRLFETLPEQSVVTEMNIARGGEEGSTDWQGTFMLTVTKFKKI